MTRVLAAVGDLIFRSKITEAAKALGADVTWLHDASEVFEQIRMGTPDLVILDLNADRLHPIDTLRTLRQNGGLESIPIVGYAGHMQAELLEQARELGCVAMTNGQFASRLPQIISGKIDE